jgi:hypothetical protein
MSVFDSSSTATTTLPSWFTSAQQNIATQAPGVYGAATAPANTVASGVVNNLNDPTANPFTTAISGLQTAQNANMNPFLESGAPNTSTPLGGLFASQNAKLDQILPQLTAQVGAGGIGTGNYGSLRGQTAINTARTGALTTLAEQQNKAAIDAMNQSIQAGQALGNVGAQYGTTGVNVANQEMMGGLPTLAKYSDIINAMGPTTDKSVATVSSKGDYANFLAGLTAIGGGGQALTEALKGNSSYPWLNALMKSGSYTGSPGGMNSGTDGDYSWLSNNTSGMNPFIDVNGEIIGSGTAIGEGE